MWLALGSTSLGLSGRGSSINDGREKTSALWVAASVVLHPHAPGFEPGAESDGAVFPSLVFVRNTQTLWQNADGSSELSLRRDQAFALPSSGRIAAGDVSFQMIDCCILFGDQPFQQITD